MITKDIILNRDYVELLHLTGADIIFLFGSILTDNFHKDSDIDIGVYFENRRYDKTAVYDTVIDFFQTEKVDVAFLNEASPLLLYQVIKNGKPMACKNYKILMEFRLRSIKKYWETKKFRKMKEYLSKELCRKNQMNWLPDDKEIFIGKLNYLKNYYGELKSFVTI